MPASPSYAGPSSMRDDLYEDGPPPDKRDDMGADDKAEHEDGQGAIVVPKEALGSKDVKVGDVCEFRADRILEKEVVFSYMPHGDKEDGEQPASDEQEQPPSSGGGEPSMFD